MTTTKKRVLLGMATFLTLGITSGAAAILDTVQSYSNACSPLDGFPGLLQSAGFISHGNCKLDQEFKCESKLCTTAGGKTGHCLKVRTSKTTYACECYPGHSSRLIE